MEAITTRKNLTAREGWAGIIEEWTKSGLPKAEFCRQNKYRYSRFIYWSIKLRQKPSKKMVAVPSTTLTSKSRQSHAPIKMYLDSCHLEIPNGFDSSTLVRLLTILDKGPRHAPPGY